MTKFYAILELLNAPNLFSGYAPGPICNYKIPKPRSGNPKLIASEATAIFEAWNRKSIDVRYAFQRLLTCSTSPTIFQSSTPVIGDKVLAYWQFLSCKNLYKSSEFCLLTLIIRAWLIDRVEFVLLENSLNLITTVFDGLLQLLVLLIVFLLVLLSLCALHLI